VSTPALPPSDADPGSIPLRRRRRWGLRTLGCLTVVITSIVVANVQGHHTLGTLGCIVLGVGAAAYCSFRGLQDLLGLEWYRRRLASRPLDES